jgi:hypothetical protein
MMGADTIAGTAHVVRTGRGFPILRVSPSPSFTASGTFHRNFGSFINTPDAAITPGLLHAPLLLGRGI